MAKIKVLAICGSVRRESSNLNLISAIRDLARGDFDFTTFTELESIAPFNPDRESEMGTAEDLKGVIRFRKLVSEHDAVLICTPEYAIGVPGVLKNALDWTVSSTEFSGKALALVTAGTGGYHAHKSLLGTLLIIEAKMTLETQVIVSMVKTKIKVTDGKTAITNAAALEALEKMIQSLKSLVAKKVPEDQLLKPPPFDGDPL